MTVAFLRRLLNLLLNPWPAAISALFLSLLFFDAFPADSLMYHLPFSARFLDLPGFPDFSNYHQGRYQGFPALWRILLGPGLAWNHPRLFIIPNIAALGLLVYCSRRLLRLSAAMTMCCCFAFPVALFGFRSSLQDFFVNTMVVIASLALFQPASGLDGDIRKPLWISRWDLLGLACLALAANVKFQGLFMAVLVLMAAIIFRLRDLGFRGVGAAVPAIKRRLVVAVLLIGLVFTQQILNTARFGNPFYPVRVLGLSGTEGRIPSPVQYIPRVPLLTNAASYLVSVTEVDPIIRSEAGFSFARSWHNHNIPKPGYRPAPFDYPFIVTGGSNGFLFVAVFTGAVLSLYGFGVMRHHLSSTPLLILKRRLLTASLFFMFLPQSMELRYYMVSLFAPAIVAVSSGPTALRLSMRWVVVLGLWFVMTVSYLQPLYFWARTGEWISARGLLSPDLYRDLPSAQQCVENSKPRSPPITPDYDPNLGDIQPLIACYFRLTQPQ
jgi:hypothetical protein